ncbi:MAG TPA: YqgE/AlgH family protein [Methylophilaceae bacterium]
MENVNLTGHFLIAMPAMSDPYFARTVTFICEHNQDGAMGIVINRPIDLRLESLFRQINLQFEDSPLAQRAVHFGGPVQLDRGFVLHKPAGNWDSTITVHGDTALTTSKDVLEAAIAGRGPDKMLVTLGYAGWAAGQLEEEMALNAWLSVKPENEETQDRLIFDTPNDEKFASAMALLGIDLAALSEQAGHA